MGGGMTNGRFRELNRFGRPAQIVEDVCLGRISAMATRTGENCPLCFGQRLVMFSLEKVDLGHHQVWQPRGILQAQGFPSQLGCPFQ